MVLSILSFLLQKEELPWRKAQNQSWSLCDSGKIGRESEARKGGWSCPYCHSYYKKKSWFENTKHGCQELEAIRGYQKFLGLSQRFSNRFNIVIFQLNNIEKTVKVTQQRKFSSILFSVDALLTSRFFNSCSKIIPSKFFFNSLKVLKPHQRLIVLCNAMRFDLTFYSALTRCTTNENVQFMILPHLGELAKLFSTSWPAWPKRLSSDVDAQTETCNTWLLVAAWR